MKGIRILHVTDGAPANMRDAWAKGYERREDYALQRKNELFEAMTKAGIDAGSLLSFDVADQSAAYQMPLLAGRLATLLQEHGTTMVLTHAYEGGHPDHDATAFVAHTAHCLLQREGWPPIQILEFPLYHSRGGRMQAQEFPTSEGCEIAIRLDAPTLTAKQEMLAAFTTQRQTLLLLDADLERFRIAPDYDFTILPNGGDLLYERFDWGLSGETWLSLVHDARERLRLPQWL